MREIDQADREKHRPKPRETRAARGAAQVPAEGEHHAGDRDRKELERRVHGQVVLGRRKQGCGGQETARDEYDGQDEQPARGARTEAKAGNRHSHQRRPRTQGRRGGRARDTATPAIWSAKVECEGMCGVVMRP